MNNKKAILLSLLSLSLFACSGGEASSSSQTPSSEEPSSLDSSAQSQSLESEGGQSGESQSQEHVHSYDVNAISWSWGADYASAKAQIPCTLGDDTLVIDATVTSEEKEATCLEDGLITYTASIEYEGTTYTNVQTRTIEAYGHQYDVSSISWSWAEDYSSALAYIPCVYGNHPLEIEATVSTASTEEATCTASGSKTHTATILYQDNEYKNVKVETIPALDHDLSYVGTDLGHSSICSRCDYEGEVEEHSYLDGFCSACGYREFTPGLSYTPIEDENGDAIAYAVSSGEVSDGEVVIPNHHNGLPVTRIEESAFYELEEITSVLIPASVTEICDNAFAYLLYSEISFEEGSGLRTIGASAFEECEGMTEIDIPDPVTTIGDSAFSWCCNATSLHLPSSLETIGEYAFSDCNLIEGTIQIPAGVASIGATAFSTCEMVEEVVFLGELVTELPEFSFQYMTSLTKITLPSSLTHIGTQAFASDESLEEIIIPLSVISAGNRVFRYCDALSIYLEATEVPAAFGEEWYGSATYYLYSEQAPSVEGNYWHYVDGVPTIY